MAITQAVCGALFPRFREPGRLPERRSDMKHQLIWPIVQITDNALEAVLDSHRWIPESWTGQGDPQISGGTIRFGRVDGQPVLHLNSWCSFTTWQIEYNENSFVVGNVIPPDPEADQALTGPCDAARPWTPKPSYFSNRRCPRQQPCQLTLLRWR